MSVKMWLDDMRNPVKYTGECDWTWVKTADEAIALLSTGNVVEASLDHDLADVHYDVFHEQGGYSNPGPIFAEDTGEWTGHTSYRRTGEKTGYDVVLWMAEHGVWPEVVRVHSMNAVGAAAMRLTIERYKPKKEEA